MEEKLIKHNSKNPNFEKQDVADLTRFVKSNVPKGVAASAVDCKTQVIQAVATGVLGIVISEMSDRKSPFNILKIFRIGKAIIALVEDVIALKKNCTDPEFWFPRVRK